MTDETARDTAYERVVESVDEQVGRIYARDMFNLGFDAGRVERVQPTRDEIAEAVAKKISFEDLPGVPWRIMSNSERTPWLKTGGRVADAILALFSSTPTVPQVQAEALREIAPEVSNRYGDRERLIARADALDPKEEN